MKLTTGLLLSALASSVCAESEDAGVYIFQKGEWPNSAKPSILSAEEARLILTQRLGVTQYHSIGDASWIQSIEKYGVQKDSSLPELILVVEGVTTSTALLLEKPFMSLEAAFKISNPPSSSATHKLIKDLQEQIGTSNDDCAIEDAIIPSNTRCWNGRSKVVQVDLAVKSPSVQQLGNIKSSLIEMANNGEMNVAVIFMPESARYAKNAAQPYGTYSMPSQVQLERRQQVEEPMVVPSASSSAPSTQVKQSMAPNSSEPILGVPKVCYTSIEDCNNSTNTCSGHGKCYKKSGTDRSGCFACQCAPTRREFTVGESKQKAFTLDYWGGAACQKEDVSGPFWLLATFSIVVVGLVAWGISMIFSIGEEKLPGVIGAGVSSKAR
ncbi:hypothetical protein BJ878DRAFT_515164 [Calycina marina]|uniref:DUF3844 domain-containing protein n=1 Tax=Calycina marina TaxID=1763456 RepID=A0A9P7YZC4_9HELO|nr:hypothetical protein BJ878DRAFT_515164 [Calycina marina]